MKAEDYISSGLLEAYVLGSLPLQEMEQVAGAMCRFPEVKQEVAAIEALLIQAEEKDAMAPPEGMEDKIWAAIQNAVESKDTNLGLQHQVVDVTEPGIQGPVKVEGIGSGVTSRTIPLSQPKTISSNWARAAVWVALLGSVLANIIFWNGKHSDQQELAGLQQKVNQMQGDQVKLAANLKRFQQEAEMTAEPGVQPVPMLSTQPGHAMAATIYWKKSEHTAYVSVQKLPPPPDGMQYQLWAIAGGKPVSIGMLDNEVAINGGMQKVPEAVMDGQAFAVSLEKAGGNASPTADKIFLVGKMPV